MEREICLCRVFQIMGFIVSSCAFVCTDNCPELFASWTMMLNFSCPTFTFPNHHQLQTWIHAAIFPFLAWSYLGIAKALKLFQVRKREISQTQKATFHIVFKGEGYSRNTVLPLWGEKKIQSFWGFFLFTSARKIISKKKKNHLDSNKLWGRNGWFWGAKTRG